MNTKVDRNIEHYVRIYNDFLSPDDCKTVISELENDEVKYEKHRYHNETHKEFSQNPNELSVCYIETETKKMLMKKMWHAIMKYQKDLGYSWFQAWSGYSDVRFNKYEPGEEMRLHCDHIHTMFDGTRRGIPTLSIVGVINDDYEGGEFIMWKDKKLDLKSGDILFFPSNFMYPHLVKPVKKGIRYSYVSWVY